MAKTNPVLGFYALSKGGTVFPDFSSCVLYCHMYIRECNFHGMSLSFSHLNMSGGIPRITSFDF